MRGRSSSAKSRLRSAGYKCNLCGRRLVDAIALERHQKTIHNVSTKSNRALRAKTTVQRLKVSYKEKEKSFDDLRNELQAETKSMPRTSQANESLRDPGPKASTEMKGASKNTSELSNNGKTVVVEKEKQDNQNKNVSKKVEFECPVCKMLFNVYFTALKHIQRVHSTDSAGNKVAPNSPDMVQPIRVEQCYRCNSKIRSTEHHICPKMLEEANSAQFDYVCFGCNQSFTTLKMFDVHVSGLHSEGVDSMFFPTKIEYTNWRLDMEWQTKARYSLLGDSESKKVYRCNHMQQKIVNKSISIAYICPSSLVVQEFSKGIQVHFYNKHYGHPAKDYTLSSKYKTYSITSFLKNANEERSSKKNTCLRKLDDKDLYPQFKKLMDGILLNATNVNSTALNKLIEKAIEMSAIITDSSIMDILTKTKSSKNITDREITKELQVQPALNKRRRSVDAETPPPNPAKRTRNKSLFMQNDDKKQSPMIVNSFSLASNSNNKDNNHDRESKSDTTEKADSKETSEASKIVNQATKMTTRLTSFNESPSFNDSYKDFIDKNFTGKTDQIKNTRSRSTVKTRLGEFKPTSPNKLDKDNISNDINANTQNIVTVKSAVTPISNILGETDATPETNVNSREQNKVKSPKVKILSIETPKVNITDVKTLHTTTPKVTTQANTPKVITQSNDKAVFSHFVDPLQVNITTMNKTVSSPSLQPQKGNLSKVNTRSGTSHTVHPIEVNISKIKTRTTPTILKTSKVIPKIVMTKIGTPKVTKPPTNTPKFDCTKVYRGPGTPKTIITALKVTPKEKATEDTLTEQDVSTTEDISTKEDIILSPTKSNTGIIKQKKVKDVEYEIREQENDCNILVLKF